MAQSPLRCSDLPIVHIAYRYYRNSCTAAGVEVQGHVGGLVQQARALSWRQRDDREERAARFPVAGACVFRAVPALGGLSAQVFKV